MNMYLQEINFKIGGLYGDQSIEDADVDKEVKRLMFIFWGVIVPIISVIGCFGNCLTIIVLFRREMQSTTVIFLRTLVVTDTAIIISGVLGLSVIAITQRDKELWRFTDIIYPNIFTPINYISMALQMINVWVTVAVSVERYIAICHPFKSVRICKKKNAFISIAVIVVLSIFYNIPRCFATTAILCDEDSNRQHGCFQLITTDFGNTLFYSQIYFFWLYMILIYIIPLVVLGVVNTLLIAELTRMRKRQTPSNVQQSMETNMSLVLVLIVLVFIICQTPGLCAQFTFWQSHTLLQLICVSNTLYILNSSVNFLIYTAAGRKFRNVLLKVFRVLINSQVSQSGTESRGLTTRPSEFLTEDMDETSQLRPIS